MGGLVPGGCGKGDHPGVPARQRFGSHRGKAAGEFVRLAPGWNDDDDGDVGHGTPRGLGLLSARWDGGCSDLPQNVAFARGSRGGGGCC